jgi:autotransporter-associated beta strand protein
MNSRQPVFIIIFAAALFWTSAPTHAATYYWDSNGSTAGFGNTTGTWGTDAFWSTASGGDAATANTTITTSDTVNFGTSLNYGASTVTGPSTAQGFQSMIFGSGQTTALTISGGTLNLNTSGSTITQNSASTMTISSVLQGSSASLTKAGTGILTLNGSAVNTFNGGLRVNAGTLRLDYANYNGNNLVNSGNALTLGGGTLSLLGYAGASNAQTFNGTTVNAGASTISVAPGSGGTFTLSLGAITRNAGGVLNFTAGSGGSITIATSSSNSNGILGPWAFVGSGASTRYATVSGGNIIANTASTSFTDPNSMTIATDNYYTTTTGNLTALTASRTANTLLYAGAGAGTITLGASGANNLALNGLMNAGSGLLTITRTGGTGTISTTGGTGELVINAANNNITIAAPIGGAIGITKTGDYALVLSSTANTYTGNVNINGGQLDLAGGAGATYTGGTITINGASSLRLTGTYYLFADKTITFGSAGGGTLNVSTSGSGMLIRGGGATFTTSGGARNTITGGDFINLDNPGKPVTFNVVRGSDSTVDLDVSVKFLNPGSITKSGDGIMTLSYTANSYTGGTIINGGTLSVATINTTGNGNLGNLSASTGTLTLGGGVLKYTGTAATFSSPWKLNDGTLSGIDVANTLTITTDAPSSTGSLTKSGAGTLILSGNNGYTGGMTISGGTLSVATINTTGAGNLGSLSASAGTLTLGGGVLKYTGTAATISSPWQLAAGTSGGIDVANTLTITTDAAATTGALTKFGAGTLILSGNNGHTGGTTISGGILNIANDNNLGGTAGTLTFNNGTLQFGGSGITISASRPVTITSSGGFVDTSLNSGTIASVIGAGSGANTTLTKTGAGDLTFSGGFNGSGTIANSGGGQLLISGNITKTGVLTLKSDSGSLVVSGNIPIQSANSLYLDGTANGTISGSIGTQYAITKNGAGTWVLTGNNTFNNSASINAGVLNIQHASALGSGNNVNVVSGAALQVQGGFTSSSTGTLNLNGSGVSSTGGALRNISGNNTLARQIVLQSASRINSDSGTLTIDVASGSAITGAFGLTIGGAGNVVVADAIDTGSLTKDGNGMLTLSGANTYTGGTTISGGILKIANNDNNLGGTAGTLTFNNGTLQFGATGITLSGSRPVTITSSGGFVDIASGNTGTIAGVIGGGGTLTKTGTGTLLLSSTANTFTGNLNINGGTLELAGGSGATYTGGTITINGAANLLLSGTYYLFTDKTITFDSTGGGTLNVGTGGSGMLIRGGGATFTTSGGARNTINGGSFINLDNPGKPVTFNVVRGSDPTVDLDVSVQIGNPGSITKAGNGIMTLGNAANYYTGGTIINGGTLSVATINTTGNGNLGNLSASTGTLTLGGGVLKYTGTAATFSSPWKLNDGTLSGIDVANTLTITTDAPSSTGSLTKFGLGTLILSGNNGFTGGTTISGGILKIANSDNNLGGTAGTLTFNNGTLQFGGSGITISASRPVTITSSGGFVDIASGNSGTIASVIGGGALTKTGSGTLTLNNVNTYTGGTTISGGILSISNDNNLGAATGTLTFGAGTLQFGADGITIGASRPMTLTGAVTRYVDIALGNSGTIASVIGGGSAFFDNWLIKTGAGDLTLSGGFTSAGTIANSGGGLLLISGNITRSGAISLQSDSGSIVMSGDIGPSGGAGSGSGIRLSGLANGTVSGVISGNPGVNAFNKIGVGTWYLLNNNTFTGTVMISGGVLNIQNSNGLGASANTATIASSAALELQSVSGITVNNASTINGTGVSDRGALRNISGNNSLTKLITLGAASRINSDSGTLTIDVASGSAITGAFGLTIGGAGNVVVADAINTGSLTKDGTGVLTLSGVNTYTGGTTISGGILKIANNDNNLGGTPGTLTFNNGTLQFGATGITISGSRPVTITSSGGFMDIASGNTGTIAGVIGGGGTLTKTGTGTLKLSSTANTFTGNLNINGGTLELGNGDLYSGGFTYTGGTITINGAANLQVTGGYYIFSDKTITFGSAGGGTLNVYSETSGMLIRGTAGATFTTSGGARSTISGAFINLDGASRSVTFNVVRGSDPTVDLDVSVKIGNPGSVIKNGNGIMTLGNSGNYYTGGTTINDGWLRLGSASALGSSTGALTMGGGTLQLNGNNLTVGNLSGSGVIENIHGSTATTLTVNQTANTTLSATLQNGAGSAALSLIKNGTGALTISGNNSYSGSTTVNAGTLVVAHANAFGSAVTAVNLGSVSGSDSAAIMVGGYTMSRPITVQSGSSGAATIGSSTANTGTFSGAVTINKDLSVAQISGGTLYMTGGITAGSTGLKTVTFSDAGSVIVTNTALANGSGTLAVAVNSGTVTMSVANTYTGGTTISGGTLKLGANNRLSDAGAVTVAGGTFALNNLTETVGTVTVNSGYITSGALTGGAFTKTTAGTGTLTARGTFTSATISQGTLDISNTSGTGLTVSGGGSVTVDGGTLRVNNTGSSYGIGSAVNVVSGTLAGSGTINGAVTINSGAHLAPGNSIESLASTTLTLNGGSVLDWEFLTDINGKYQGSLDQYYVSGIFTLNGTVNINLLQYNSFYNNGDPFDDPNQLAPPQPQYDAQSYKLIRYGTLAGTGTFSVANPSTGRDYMFRTINDAGNNWMVLDISQEAGYWSGNGGSDSWADGGNWGGTGPSDVPPPPDAWIYFQGFTRPTPSNDMARAYNRVIFRATTTPFTVNGATLTLATLIQNDTTATHTMNTPIVMNAGTGQFQMNTASGNLVITGDISGTGTLTKLGNKILELTGNNTYGGVTDIQAGTLRVSNLSTALSPNSNLKFSGGILESSGTFDRALGGGGGSVQWTGSGGFSARNGTLTVNLGGGVVPGTVQWNSGSFTPTGSTLKFSSSTANSTVRFMNSIDLGSSGTRVIEVANGTAAVDAELVGALTGSASLTKTGAGRLMMSANSSYTGATTVNAGVLEVNGSLTGSSVLVSGGATLGGTGTISGTTTISSGAHLSPAMEQVGAMRFGSTLSLADSFIYDWQLGASLTDRVDVATLNFTGSSWTLNLGIEAGLKDNAPWLFGPQGSNAVYTLFTFNSGTASANALAASTITFRGNGYWNTENAQVLVQGNNVVLTGVWLIPEPSVLVLWLSGLATVIAARRRRRK